MRRIMFLLTVACLLGAVSVCAQKRTESEAEGHKTGTMRPSPGQYRWLTDGGRTEIPFELVRNHVIIPARVNGYPLKLVLDTGMPTHGVVLFGGPETDSIPLDFAGEAMVGGVGGGVTRARVAANVTLGLPGLELKGQTVIAMPSDQERSLAFEDRAGAIGYSLFSRFVVRIDFDKMVISVEEPPGRPRSDTGAEVPFELVNNSPRVKCVVELLDGSVVPVELVVDLGASHAVSLKAYGDSKIRVPSGAIEANIGRGVGGVLTGYVGRIKSLSLGGLKLENVVASFRTKAHEGAPGLDAIERDGNLGTDALRRFNVAFDYKHKTMLLEPNGHSSEPFEFNMAGFDYSRTAEGAFVVDRVVPNSPASDAGLSVGDVVAEVNGRAVSGMGADSLRRLLLEPGKKVTLSFVRSGKEKQTTLTLRRLL